MATIDDVAKAAGVSKSTVSNVFSKKRPISKEVTEHVLEVARRLNYRPNYWARTLATKETRIIGLNMLGEKVKFSQFHLSLINGVLEECYERGYRLLVNTLSNRYQDRVEFFSTDPVDGEILLDPKSQDFRIADRLSLNLPLVVIGKPPGSLETKISYVDNDNVGTAQQVTQYLIELGHREILFLNAPKDRTVSYDRELGYRYALGEAEIEVEPSLLIYKEDEITSVEYGYQKAKQLLTARPSITAVIADTDKVALGVYRASAELGLKIPEDLSVVAFSDDSVFSPEFTPSLTSVRLNGEALGKEAAKILIEQCMTGQTHIKRVIVPTQFVIRGSTAKARKTIG